MTFDESPVTGERSDGRALELVWLAPVLIATVATLLTTDRLVVVAPLLAVALLPWVLQALRRPVPVWLFGAFAVVPVAVLLVLQGLSSVMFLGTTALCVLAGRASRAWQLAAVVLLAVLLPFTSALSSGPFDPGSFYFAIGDLFGVAVGVLLGYSLRLAAQLRIADARLLAAEAQQERTRLARDVHDLVAHSLTVVVLHVGGARRILRTDPVAAGLALEQAEQVCRESLDGIRRVVGLLRTDDEVPAGTGDLLGLVQTYRTAGMRLDVDFDDRVTRLPPVVRSLLHRVAQEALSNAARYRSADSTVDIACTIDEEDVTLVVGNLTGAERHASGGGFGLIGLQEQVAGAGGVLTGRYDRGRWHLECRLPVDASFTVAQSATR